MCINLTKLCFCFLIVSNFFGIVVQAQQQKSIVQKSGNPPDFNNYYAGFEYILSGRSIRFIGKTPSSGFQLHRFYGGKKIFRHPKNLFAIYYTVSAGLFSELNYTVNDTGKEKHRYGFGISPAGYTFMIPISKEISVNAGFSGGLSTFDKLFPDKNGIPLNFTYSLNSALLIRLNQEFWLTARGRYYHHSNAEIGKVNPGLDLIMLSAGFQAQF
jgi:hypothetical protein